MVTFLNELQLNWNRWTGLLSQASHHIILTVNAHK